MATIQGERIPGGFILITGIDGTRYAVRHNAVAVIHDADECHDETLVQLYGGAVVRVPCSLDEVLGGSRRRRGWCRYTQLGSVISALAISLRSIAPLAITQPCCHPTCCRRSG